MSNKKEKPTNRVSYGIRNMFDDIVENKKAFLITMAFDGILSIICVSYVTQLIVNLFTKNDRITIGHIFTAWLAHPVSIFLTLVVFCVFCFASYKVRLIFKQDHVPNYDDNYETAETSEYGQSHWAGEEEKEVILERSPNFNDIKGDILGFEGEVIETHGDKHKYHITNICSKKAGLLSTNNNKIAFGSAGSGKSAAVVLNDIIQAMKRGDSVIATDSKGDVYRDTAAIMAKHGYTVRILNLKPEELANSDAWEPLKYVGASTESEIQADVLAQAIITNTLNGARMDFWADNEKNCLKATILLVAQSADYENRRSMEEVSNIVSDPDRFDSKFVNLPEDSPAKRAFNIYSVAKDDVKKQILNGMAIRLQLLNNPYVKNIMSHDEMDLVLPMKKKCIYYVCISDTDTTMKFVAAMFFTQIFQAQCNYSDSLTNEEKKKQLSVVYELDEFKNIGAIPDFDTKISTFRSRKISSTLILQNISQLKEMFPMEQHQTILGNTTTHILLKAGDTDTAQHFTDLCGKTTVRVENSRYDKRRSQIVDLHDEEGVSEGLGQRDILMMNEAMQLSPDDMIVCIMGFPPLRLHKYITELYNPIFKKDFKEMKPNRHRPKWMKELMEAEQKDKEYIEQLRKGREESIKPAPDASKPKHLPDPAMQNARNTQRPGNAPQREVRPQGGTSDKRPATGIGNAGNNKAHPANNPSDRPKSNNNHLPQKSSDRNMNRQGERGTSNRSEPGHNMGHNTENSMRNSKERRDGNNNKADKKPLMNITEEEFPIDDSLPGMSATAAGSNKADTASAADSPKAETNAGSKTVAAGKTKDEEDAKAPDIELTEEDIQDDIPEEEVATTKGADMFSSMFSDGDFF